MITYAPHAVQTSLDVFITKIYIQLRYARGNSSYTGCGIKKQPLRKIKFLKNYKTILLCFPPFNAEIITYKTCEFHGNILSKNKTMAVRIKKCTLLSEQQLK